MIGLKNTVLFLPSCLICHITTPQIYVMTLCRGQIFRLGPTGLNDQLVHKIVKLAPPRAAATVNYCLHIDASVVILIYQSQGILLAFTSDT